MALVPRLVSVLAFGELNEIAQFSSVREEARGPSFFLPSGTGNER